MNNAAIADHKRRVDNAFSRADTVIRANRANRELHQDLSCYLCVLVSGFLEQSLKTLVKEYVRNRSRGHVPNYVETTLRSVNAPKWEGIAKLYGSFDYRWKSEIEALVSMELKTTVNSLVKLRNQIAHGVSISLPFSEVQTYYIKAIEVVTQLDAFMYDPRWRRLRD